MIRWDAEPLWAVFESQGIDPATMRPFDVPKWPSKAERWRRRKALARVERYLDKAERPGFRGQWALAKAGEYLDRARTLVM